MVKNKESQTQSFTFRENEKIPEETKKKEEKEAVLSNNATTKKSALQKRRKACAASSGRSDISELREQSNKTEKQHADDMLLDRMESLDVCEDGQGPPLSLKNLLKAVKSFSKRKPKLSPKLPEQVTKGRKETDVVVFERLATPRSFYKSGRVSRSLPPIMDIHELLSAEIQAEGEKLGRDLNCFHSEGISQTLNTEETHGAVTCSEPSNQPSILRKKELRRHRCSGFLHELEPDGLQEFGSIDVSIGNGDREHRISRKSLGYLRNTYEEHEALHF